MQITKMSTIWFYLLLLMPLAMAGDKMDQSFLQTKMSKVFTDLSNVLKHKSEDSQGCETYKRFGRDHTMCLYQSKACTGKTLIKSGIQSCDDKIEIVGLHNEIRQNVSLGRVPGQPWAQNMVQMVWDDELAQIAQRWADQCTFGHDTNPNVDRFMVGQNVYLYSVSANMTDMDPNFSQAILRWYNEYTKFPGTVDPYIYEPTAGHYTQLAWGATSAVGCGYVMYKSMEEGLIWTNKMYVCNYGVHGNLLGGKMYKVGRRNCNKFPNLFNSTVYTGLCEMKSLRPSSGIKCVAEHRKKYRVKNIEVPVGTIERHKIA